MCSSTPQTTFAWAGAFIIIIAFISIVSIGTAINWIAGFVLCGIFSAVLIYFARYLDVRYKSHAAATTFPASVGVEGDIPAASEEMKLLSSILYGLGLIAIGACGLILTYNIWTCGYYDDDDYNGYKGGLKLNVNTTLFPKDVKAWYNQLRDNSNMEVDKEFSFVYINGTNTMLFSGTSLNTESWDYDLYRLETKSDDTTQTSADGPERFTNITSPANFVLINGGNLACFVGYTGQGIKYNDKQEIINDDNRYNSQGKMPIVACSNGSTVASTFVPDSNDYNTPDDLYAAQDGSLWFTSWSREYNYQHIFSMIPGNMEVTLHDQSNDNDDGYNDSYNDSNCDRTERNTRAKGSLLLSMMPVFIISVAMFVKLPGRKVSSLPIVSYAALTGAVIELTILFADDENDTILQDVLKGWFSSTSTIWLYAMSILFLTNRFVGSDSLVWSLNVSSLVYFGGMVALIGIFEWYDDAWRWILYNVIVVLPLIFLGLVTNMPVMLLLGAAGLLLNVWRIADFIGDSFVGDEYVVFVRFIFLALAGVGICFLGIWLQRNSQPIKTWVDQWARRMLGSWRVATDGDIELADDINGDDESSQVHVHPSSDRSINQYEQQSEGVDVDVSGNAVYSDISGAVPIGS